MSHEPVFFVLNREPLSAWLEAFKEVSAGTAGQRPDKTAFRWGQHEQQGTAFSVAENLSEASGKVVPGACAGRFLFAGG